MCWATSVECFEEFETERKSIMHERGAALYNLDPAVDVSQPRPVQVSNSTHDVFGDSNFNSQANLDGNNPAPPFLY